jgi:polar amino acid transport system substrate-binding protein
LGLLFVSTITATPSYADVLSRIRADGKIRIAIAAPTPPYSYIDSRNQLAGSDVDTARLLAKDLGVKLEIVRIINSDRIPALQERRTDLVVSALSITPERERQIAFSVPYAQIPIVIAASHPLQLSSMLDLNGKTVGVLANSSNQASLMHDAPGATVIQYPENDKLIAGYVAGEFEIISTPQSVVDAFNQTKPKRPLLILFTQSVFDIAIGMPNGEKPLRDWINAWVVSNLRNENLGNIFRKHHGRALPGTILPSADVVKK